ncbi:uncharacterized protein MYCGRDRAFT_96002 [Zymoseptoria tritici IPO323]|uniref:Uncharacterized protein n=1 Tax=Zymoseptoria tritici (strain CBS 115943 / IPO323) TaxID=336722 RepID=F9XKJ4_ZYMTI|nr:uncharacterized protein MYCGRDRAFT_96002 [Zymoseptoria tritici IPO323]EGP84226.1 hypothetical protein MYCGRDRAFT_96002 [Zymoseptoria tritici IPO323]
MKMEKQQDYYPLGHKITYDTVEVSRVKKYHLRNITTNTIDFFNKLLAFTRELGPRFTVIGLVGAGFFYIASLVVYNVPQILPLPLNPDESIQAGGLNFFGVIACAFTICLELYPFAVAVCNLLSTTIVESDKNYA